MKFTRQGVRDLSAMGPKNPERNKKATDYGHGPVEAITDPIDQRRGLWLRYESPAYRPIFGDPNLGDE